MSLLNSVGRVGSMGSVGSVDAWIRGWRGSKFGFGNVSGVSP